MTVTGVCPGDPGFEDRGREEAGLGRPGQGTARLDSPEGQEGWDHPGRR